MITMFAKIYAAKAMLYLRASAKFRTKKYTNQQKHLTEYNEMQFIKFMTSIVSLLYLLAPELLFLILAHPVYKM